MARFEEARTEAHADGASVSSRPAAPPPQIGDEAFGGTDAAERFDRIRWGPVWGGALVALTTFFVLQLLLFALGWLDLSYDGPNSATATAVVSGVLVIIAFFVGGLTAGAGLTWRGSMKDGVFNGVLVWALTFALIVLVALIGGTSLAGPIGQFLTVPPSQLVDPGQLLATARTTAGWTALFLGLTVGAAAMGAGVGTKEAIWSRRKATSSRT